MPGGDKQVTDQSQSQLSKGFQSTDTNSSNMQTGSTSSATGPWAPTQNLLNEILSKYSGINTGVTADQSAAAANLTAGANAAPNMGATAAAGVDKLFQSNTAPQVGMLTDALKQYQSNVGATASGAELDPYQTPGFAQALETMSNDIRNQVKSVYAGSGRDPSGAGSFGGNLGRKITEGVAPVIAAQFNQNKGNQLKTAADLNAASGNAASNITGQQQVPLSNILQGVGALPGVNSAFTAPGASQMAAANNAYSLPYGNLSQMLAPLLQMAGAGTQTTGSTTGASNATGSGSTTQANASIGQGHGETTAPQSTMSNVLGGITGAAGLASLFGGAGGIGALAPLLALSDERTKEDIEEIGTLHDGQPVVRFKYKGMPRTEIGLLAQNVERVRPQAVHEFGGLKLIDPKMATDEAAKRAA